MIFTPFAHRGNTSASAASILPMAAATVTTDHRTGLLTNARVKGARISRVAWMRLLCKLSGCGVKDCARSLQEEPQAQSSSWALRPSRKGYARHGSAELLGKRDDDALRPADVG
jgi:hypothetical protein